MRKLITASLVIVLLILGSNVITKSPGPVFEDRILTFGFSFAFLGLLFQFVQWASSIDKNSLRWAKKRLELGEKIVGLKPEQKIFEEIKLLKEGQFHGERLTIKLIEKFELMPLEKAEKIGTETELKKLSRAIKFAEETLPFYCNVLLVTGILLILIYRFYFK